MSPATTNQPLADQGAGVPDELEADAIRSIREPITQLEEATIWLIQAGLVEQGQRAYQLWIELRQEHETVLNQMVYDAVQAATLPTQEG